MNKIDVIKEIAKKNKVTDKQAREIVDSVFDGFTNELKNGGRIEIRGFGSFSVREYGVYKGRNPKTGEKIDVKSKKLPFFRPGREIKKKVDNS